MTEIKRQVLIKFVTCLIGKVKKKRSKIKKVKLYWVEERSGNKRKV